LNWRVRVGPLLIAAISGLACVTPSLAQTSRLATVPAMAEVHEGDALVGFGFSYGLDQSFPLSGLRGDLLTLGRIRASYALAEHALLEFDLDAVRVLWVDEAGPAPAAVRLRPVDVGSSTADVGDMRLGLTYTPFTIGSDVVLGGWFAVEGPNSEEHNGIGTNTTNFLLGAVASVAGDQLTVSGRLGLGILQSPLFRFTQDDVVVYSMDAVIRAREGLRFILSVDGRVQIRRTVSLGLEDLGLVKVGVELGQDAWRLDAAIGRGFARRSPNWQFALGLSWVTRGHAEE